MERCESVDFCTLPPSPPLGTAVKGAEINRTRSIRLIEFRRVWLSYLVDLLGFERANEPRSELRSIAAIRCKPNVMCRLLRRSPITLHSQDFIG
jgi:hypothetical protein